MTRAALLAAVLWVLPSGSAAVDHVGTGSTAAYAVETVHGPSDALRDRLAARLAKVGQEGFPADTDTIVADSLRRDSLVRADSLARAAAADTVEARREGLAGGEFPERDSIFRRLMEMPGFRTIEYRGEAVQLQVEDEHIELRRSAQANYGDAALRSDSIDYRAPLQFLSARGDITLVSPDRQEVMSDSVLYYDVSRRKGTVMSARTQFSQQGAAWYIGGNAVPVGQDTLFVHTGDFTTCELEEPHYHFSAGQIKFVREDLIVAWPVVLYISDVPVMWLPFFAQDLRPDRRSGIIPPQFGINDIVRTSGGFNRHISDFGYYWAINEYLDARFTMDWYSGRYTTFNGAFRYRFLKHFLEGDVAVSRQLGETGNNFSVRFNHDQRLSPETRLRASGRFVQNTRLFRDRSFDPEEQTRTIDSDVGLTHRFSFADLTASARRRQFLGPDQKVDLTLPDVRLSFSPLTLFRAPRTRAGFFDNIVLTGSANFTRKRTTDEGGPDRERTSAAVSQSLRIQDLSISNSARLEDLVNTPIDSLGADLPSRNETRVNLSSSADYQIDLMGSTTFSPTLQVEGALFRSPETRGEFVPAPVRPSFGARLRTDIYGFLPGIGAIQQVRHKISPSFTWTYAPAVAVADTLADLPGFPRSGRARNQLRISFNQTFEAKIRREVPREEDATEPEEREPGETPPAEEAAEETDREPAAEDAPGAADRPGAPEEALPDEAVPDTAEAAVPDSVADSPEVEERKVVLLAINTSALSFDFENAGMGEPVLETTRMRNSISSDLLRGVSINVEHDLFEGSGAGRRFDPHLASLNASFTLSSTTGLGGLVGLGGGRTGPARQPPQAPGGPGAPPGEDRERMGAGPWSLSLSYSLNRPRATDGFSSENQSLNANLSLQPTPNWRVRWRTQYNFTEGEFGQHFVSLQRDLHRWQANFTFSRAPNGNFAFQFRVSLTDVPDLKFDYDQRSEPPLR